MAKSKKKKFIRLLSKNKKTIFVCFLIFAFLLLISYSYKPPHKSEIEVHTGYIQDFESHHYGGRSAMHSVVLLNNQRFHLGSDFGAQNTDLEMLQNLQKSKTQITIEVAERNILSKILGPSYSNIPYIYGMRSEDQVYRNLGKSINNLLAFQILYVCISPFPLIAMFFILKTRWESA